MTEPKIIPTVAEIQGQWAKANARIDAFTMVPAYTITDYPIGSGNRGSCRLEFENTKGKGSRTVRTTTDKNGRWCKPKKSTYQDHPVVVVIGGELNGKGAAWLRMDCGMTGPYLQYANGDNEVLCEPPHWTKPRREDRHYTTTVNGVEQPQSTISADPPELCNAWEEWFEGYKLLFEKVVRARESFAVEQIS